MTIPLEITNTEIAHFIDEYIRSERDRAMLKRRYIDGICYEPRIKTNVILAMKFAKKN